MKKVFAIMLLLMYGFSSMGMSVNLHYCMGDLIGKSLWQSGHNQCGTCDEEKTSKKSNGCCSDEQKQLKIDQEQKVVEMGINSMQVVLSALPVSYFLIPTIHFSSITEENPTGNAPPRCSSISLYKRNCVFLI